MRGLKHKSAVIPGFDGDGMVGSSVNLAGAASVLARRKALIVFCGLLTACLAFAVTLILPRQYVSEGSLIIEHPSSAGNDPRNPSVLTGILTQVDVIQSRGLLRRSVSQFADTPGLKASLRIPAPVEQWVATILAPLSGIRETITQFLSSDDSDEKGDKSSDVVNYVQQHLRVETKESSSVISVKYEAGDPGVASSVVNSVMSTYLSTVNAARDDEVDRTDRWIVQQRDNHQKEIQAAEQRVTQFMRENKNLTEIQGTLTASMQLSKDQAQLAAAQEDLTKQQAALDTIYAKGAVAGSDEALSSKTIQSLKEQEAKTLEQIGAFADYDPRRSQLQARVGAIRSQIKNEYDLLVNSLSRSVQVTRARVQALEKIVQRESEVAQVSTIAGSTLKQLTSDLDAKRQQFLAFSTAAGQARLNAVQASSARVLFWAVPPQKPLRSFGPLSLVLGFISGAVAASAVVIMRSALSVKINSASEMAIVTDLPVLGSLPEIKRSRSKNALMLHNEPAVTETFRSIWLAMRSPGNEGTAILVTSSEASEGKTTVAMSLARRFADDGFRVLLIDADLRRPQVAKALDLQPRATLETLLTGHATLETAVVQDPHSSMRCLLSNGEGKNPLRSLSSDPFKRLLNESRQSYDYVIVDTAPVLQVADAVLLANYCQHIIFVVEAGRVPGDLVAEATRRFREEDRAKMSTLLTRVPTSRLDKRDYYGGYAN